MGDISKLKNIFWSELKSSSNIGISIGDSEYVLQLFIRKFGLFIISILIHMNIFMKEISINFPPHFIGIWCPRLRMENWSCGTVTVRTKSMLYRWDRRGWWPVPTPHQEVLWPAEVSTIFAPFTGNNYMYLY